MSAKRKKVKIRPNIPNMILTLLAIVFLVVMVYKFNYKITDDMLKDNNLNETNTIENTIPPEEEKKDISVSMAVVGDIMCHNTNYMDAYDKATDTYDFTHMFTNVADYLRNADITIGNLETTFAGKKVGYSSYPTFNTPEALATNLKELGFDVLSTTNNHSLDKGYNGLVSTIEKLDEVGISHMGTYVSAEAQAEILTKDVNGIKMAFLGYTYGTNGIPVPKGKEYCINLIDKELIKKDLDKAKNLGVDLICVCMHWGEEYRLKPTKNQQELADFLFQNGVDIIFGSHAHVLEPMEKREITLADGTVKPVFLIYSLGNFISGQVKEYTTQAIILNVKVTKHKEGNMTIDDVSYIPTYVDNRGANAKERYKILDVNKSIADYENKTDTSISTTLYQKLIKVRDSTEKILSNNM